MNIVNYMNHFWFQNQYYPCSSSETALFSLSAFRGRTSAVGYAVQITHSDADILHWDQQTGS